MTHVFLEIALLAACTGKVGDRSDPGTAMADTGLRETGSESDPAKHWYRDSDGDGYGAAGDTKDAVEVPHGYVVDGTDCDDTDAAVHPSAPEICNDSDDNCNSLVDEGIRTTTWHLDSDADGWGDDSATVEGCTLPAGYSAMGGDCDDGDSSVHPEAEEFCGNEVDDDCTGGDARCGLENAVSLDAAEVKYLGGGSGDRAGAWLACGGDGNGDGSGDLVIGETEQFREEYTGTAGDGGAWLISPAIPGVWELDAEPASVWGEPGASFDTAFFLDANRDGLDDLFLGPNLFLGPVTGHKTASLADAFVVHAYDSLGVGSNAGVTLLSDGYALAGAGNLFQDGRWGASVGAAFVFDGTLSGAVSTDEAVAILSPPVDHEYGYFGWSMCSGDLDGDGVSDLVIGAPSIYPTSYADFMSNGVAYVVHGPFSGDLRMATADGVLEDADARIQGAGSVYNVGYATACGGDADGDGLDDILLGAPDWSGAWEGGQGDAVLFQSPVEGVWTTVEATARITGFSDGEYLGTSVALDADLNGDARHDVLVGSSAEGYRGEVYLFFGALAGVVEPSSADVTLLGEVEGDLAAVVGSCPDLDGNGVDDLLVGAPGESTNGMGSGAAYVVLSVGEW